MHKWKISEEDTIKTANPDIPIVTESDDNVNHPAHYTKGGIECLDAIRASMSDDEYRAYLKGNIIKYIWRYQWKNGIEDLKKAEFYLKDMISTLEDEDLTMSNYIYDHSNVCHCSDYDENKCPSECFRARITKELKEADPPWTFTTVSYGNFLQSCLCPLNEGE